MPRPPYFVHPWFDVAIIGGGLSLAVVTTLRLTDTLRHPFTDATLPALVLAVNLSHFAASTVRLYTKPGMVATAPGLTAVLPLVMFGVALAGVAWPDGVGRHLHALYLTWSPYHYAAQAYGLASMYALRAGSLLTARDRWWLWGACMASFAHAITTTPAAGIAWLWPDLGPPARAWLATPLALAAWAGPLTLALGAVGGERPLPRIAWLVVAANAAWWVWLPTFDAFVWATIFHGAQYLAIVGIFHVRDHAGDGSPVVSALRFYATCLALGWALFEVWPYAFVALGFPLASSMLLTTAVVNVHHFIVDRGIWRVRGDANRRIVMDAAPTNA